MRIIVLPGIWPPDVGGPATHGPELARFLIGRGHAVQVVTMASAPPTERPCPVTTIDRGRPFPRSLRRADAARRSVPLAAGRRRLRIGHLRRGRRGERRRAPAARREARLRPGVRARPPLGPLRRDARGVPARRAARRLTGAEAGADVVARVVPGRWSSRAGTSPRSRAAGGSIRIGCTSSRTRRRLRGRRRRPSGSGLVFAGRLTRQKAMHVAIDALAYVPDDATDGDRRRSRPRPPRAARPRAPD